MTETPERVRQGGSRTSGFDEVPDTDGIDLREFCARLASRWKFLLAITAGGTVFGALVAFLLPSMYTATALIISPVKAQSLSSILMGQLGGVAGAIAPSLGFKDPAEQFIGILGSRTIVDVLIGRFALQKVYGSRTREDARRKLLRRASFSSGKDSMIRISVEDRDPRRAADLANAFIAELNQQNDRLAITESAQRRVFFEREVETEKNTLSDAERTLKETEQRTGVVEVGEQAQVVIGAIARLRAEIAVQEVSLDRLRLGETDENPQVAAQQSGISTLRNELSKLEVGTRSQRSGDPLVPVADVPQAGLEYLRALREVKYHNSLLEVLAKQFEAAKIDEAKEAPAIQVVDAAVPPEKTSFPPRVPIIVMGAALSAAVGALYVHFSKGESSPEPLISNPAGPEIV
jgi:uncharacterized protein involved in exopolysaccharide biosynthesis